MDMKRERLPGRPPTAVPGGAGQLTCTTRMWSIHLSTALMSVTGSVRLFQLTFADAE